MAALIIPKFIHGEAFGVRQSPAALPFRADQQKRQGTAALQKLRHSLGSGQQILHDLAFNIGQPKVASLETVGQLGVIESKQLQ